MSFQESQQGHLFTNLLAATLESPFLLSKAAILIWGIAYSVVTILFEYIDIQINVHSAYRVILRYLSWTSSTGENRRENAVIQDW